MNRKNITVICGPMFSGKTKSLILKIAHETNHNQKPIAFKPFIDNRYSDDYIVSHDKNKIKSKTIKESIEILNYINEYDVFAIDEVQFFDNSLISVCKELLKKNKKIITAGLDKDYLTKPFKLVSELIELSDNVIKLNAVCVKCGKDANLSFRTTHEKDLILIGESEKYEARCEKCYYNN